jgi:hypothetical protein
LAKALGAKANAAANETPKATDFINFEPIAFLHCLPSCSSP